MKKLFKNLMLVAVAAMAFTACTETNEEVNAVSEKTIINGVAVIENDDTRSGFVGSETIDNGDGTTTTVYKSAWDGGETIKLYINYGAAETTAIVDAQGKFTAEFEGDFAESYVISACSPAEAWNGESSFTIPTEQTPRTNSVDPAAHILKAQAITVTNGSASFKMQHEVAYGKMTVNTPAGFVIDHVDIELNGAWYGNDKSLSYTINADNVENNTFWFATDVIEVSEMTVTAYDADDKAYTKTVTMNEEKTLKFQYYKVSTFSVSDLVEYKEPAAPAFTVDYQYTTLSWNNSSSRFELTGNGYGMTQFYLNSSDSPNNNSIKPGTYTYAGNTISNPAVGTFSLRFILGSGAGSSHYVNDASMSVTIEDGQYCIVITIISAGNGNIVGKTFGYKGLPSDFVLPDGGGNEGGETPDPEEPTIKESYNVTWEYYLNSSSGNTFGHIWNVTSGDGGFSAQITTDSRNSYSTETSFTPGTFLYHAQYADGDYGSGMYFTMRNIEIEGKGYSNYDIDGEMVVTIENGAYTITVDLYNKVNGNRTDKITTLNGTFGNAEQGGSEGGETPDPENPGDGGETSTWSFTPSLEGGMMTRYCTFIFTGDDGDTISSYFVYPNKAQLVGTYTVSTLNNLDGTNYRMSEIRLNGIYATSGSGSVTISLTNDGGHLFELDLVLNGKTYKGSAALYME